MPANKQTTDEWQRALGAQVRSARIDAGHDQARLAELAGVSVASIGNLETGRGSSLQTLIRVVRALGKTSWLESLSPPPTISPLRLADSAGRTKTRSRVSRRVPRAVAENDRGDH